MAYFTEALPDKNKKDCTIGSCRKYSCHLFIDHDNKALWVRVGILCLPELVVNQCLLQEMEIKFYKVINVHRLPFYQNFDYASSAELLLKGIFVWLAFMIHSLICFFFVFCLLFFFYLGWLFVASGCNPFLQVLKEKVVWMARFKHETLYYLSLIHVCKGEPGFLLVWWEMHYFPPGSNTHP